MAEDDYSGSPDIEAETIRKRLVPPKQVKSEAEKAWEENLIKEAHSRITRRTYLFRAVLSATGMLFATFLGYVIWVHLCTTREVDHLLLWLLGALPAGLVFVLIKLTSEPKKDEPMTTWPDELIKIGNTLVDVIADVVKKKLE